MINVVYATAYLRDIKIIDINVPTWQSGGKFLKFKYNGTTEQLYVSVHNYSFQVEFK